MNMKRKFIYSIGFVIVGIYLVNLWGASDIRGLARKYAVLKMLRQKNLNMQLLYAIHSDMNIVGIKSLINRGAQVNCTDQSGKTPLMYAVTMGNNELVSFLLERGVRVSQKDKAGNTAFDFVSQNNQEMINLLESYQ
jgi:ankyrin repeat protein